ncbi:hypothetical protein O9499_19655, partial [Proteus mirabilis]
RIICRGMPAHGMDTNAILINIAYSDEHIRELVDKGLSKIVE